VAQISAGDRTGPSNVVGLAVRTRLVESCCIIASARRAEGISTEEEGDASMRDAGCRLATRMNSLEVAGVPASAGNGGCRRCRGCVGRQPNKRQVLSTSQRLKGMKESKSGRWEQSRVSRKPARWCSRSLVHVCDTQARDGRNSAHGKLLRVGTVSST
jgi:hypothetical protein